MIEVGWFREVVGEDVPVRVGRVAAGRRRSKLVIQDVKAVATLISGIGANRKINAK